MKNFRLTNLFVPVAIILSLMVFAAGCKQSPTSISKGVILNQTNKKMKLDACDRNVAWIRVGKYEVPDSTERAKLKKLAIDGLITYKVTRYAWWEKSSANVRKAVSVTRNFYGYLYKDTEYRTVKADNYDFNDHYVVDVGLTKKGQKLLTELPEAYHNQDKEVQMDCDLENPAEYIWNKKFSPEVWPEIENPFIDKKESSSNSSVSVESKRQGGDVKHVASEKVTRIDSLQYQAYMQLDLTKYKNYYFKAFNIKAAKVRNIQIFEESGAPRCKAELILVLNKVTDAGRIYYNVSEGEKYFHTIYLDYYIDKGWILDAEPLREHIMTQIFD